MYSFCIYRQKIPSPRWSRQKQFVFLALADPSRPSLASSEESNVQQMEKASNVQEIEFKSVFKVIGEPATVIYGVPDLTPGFITTIRDTTSSPASDDDPCFGEWLEGRKIQKLFGDKYHYGKVEEYDKETNFYRVVYEDGEYENMEWHELEEVLLPLDISIPLTTLALARCKSEKSVSALSKGRNGYSNCSGRKKKSELLQPSHMGEPQGGLEANFSGNTRHGNLQLQNGLQRENTTAPNMCNGEPATVISGVPDVTPGRTKTIMDNLEQADGPISGERIEGIKVQKLFGDRYYLGKVEKYDKETKWYRVVYEDGDFEDLEWHELEKLLVPLDISVPLTTMALHTCKFGKSFSEPVIELAEARERDAKCSGSMEKTMEASVRKRRRNGNFNMQNELETETLENRLQMCSQEESSAGEALTILKSNQNGESVGKMLNMFQSPKTDGLSGDESVLTGARSLNQSRKTARAEKQRRKKSFVHHSACHPK